MKKLVSVQEVSGEGLEALLGEYIVVWCMSYNYTGKLIGVNEKDILLTDAQVVFETGALCSSPKTAEALPSDLYIRTEAIECYYKRA